MATISYSISIKLLSNNQNIFNGTFTVDTNTNLITSFYNNNNLNTNILVLDYEYGADYIFINGNFTFGGVNISSIPYLDNLFGATEWQLSFDTAQYFPSPYCILQYKDNTNNWNETFSPPTRYVVWTITPQSNICFPAKTPVLTDQGVIPIDSLDPKKHTIHNQKIMAITKTVSNDKYLVCIDKDALGPNVPNKQTVMSRNHKIFYKGLFIESYKLIDRLGKGTVKKVKYDGQPLYNALLEDYSSMKVNNMRVETLHPENEVAKLFR